MKNQFTKGPWDLSQQKSFIVKRDSKGNFTQESTIAEVYETPDAHLISAAPDVYEALEGLLEYVKRVHPKLNSKIFVNAHGEKIKRALEKARGEK